MVGPGEVDDDLQHETAEECSKYGQVANVIIFEVLALRYWQERVLGDRSWI